MTTCETCGRAVVTVDTKVGDQAITMRSCSRCDTRSWHRDRDVIDLADVLDITAAQAEKDRSKKRA